MCFFSFRGSLLGRGWNWNKITYLEIEEYLSIIFHSACERTPLSIRTQTSSWFLGLTASDLVPVCFARSLRHIVTPGSDLSVTVDRVRVIVQRSGTKLRRRSCLLRLVCCAVWAVRDQLKCWSCHHDMSLSRYIIKMTPVVQMTAFL